MLAAAPVPGAAAAPICHVAATGGHSRDQVLAVRLTGECPAAGMLQGSLRFSQFPSLTGTSSFTLDWEARRLHLHVPTTVWLNAGYTAGFAGTLNAIAVTATPLRHVHDQGQATITGGFTASNHAGVAWHQTVKVMPARIDVGGVAVTAHFPGGRSMLLQVRVQRGFCATGHPCPYGTKTVISSFVFPASSTFGSAHSASYWTLGSGFTALHETVTVVLRDKLTGRVLGRSDFFANVGV